VCRFAELSGRLTIATQLYFMPDVEVTCGASHTGRFLKPHLRR
jgi:hypothetical protein